MTPATSRGHSRIVLLFLIAVILPSLVLVLFAVRMIRQEQELAEKRRADDRRRLTSDVSRHLLMRLESIKLQASSARDSQQQSGREYLNPEVVLVSPVRGEELLLPWEENTSSDELHRDWRLAIANQNIRSGENEEFANRNPKGAADWYHRALRSARDPLETNFARLALARALMKAGRTETALEHYRSLLAAPTTTADEYGIALPLYAAKKLLEAGTDHSAVLTTITGELGQKQWHSPAETYLIRDLLERLVHDAPEQPVRDAAEACHQELVDYVRLLEQILSLHYEFRTLGFVSPDAGASGTPRPAWILYGDDPWLVGLTQPEEASLPLLVAVQAQKVLSYVWFDGGFSTNNAPLNMHFATLGEEEQVYLGPNFPRVGMAFSEEVGLPPMSPYRTQRSVYTLALILVLSVTMFGSYLLWRDVRRELHMAQMRSQFVSSVSHELKTPLTAIRMFGETLSLGRSKNRDSQREYLDIIVSESERLTRLLNNVLDFSKIEMGRMVYRLKPTSPGDIIQAAARTMQYPLSQQGFHLNVQIEEGLPKVRVDRDAIEQAVLNLLSNAMKYSGDSRDIDLRLAAIDGDVVIQVTDRGMGIDAGEQKKIFEKFHRVGSPENQRITGTGLGLALVAHAVNTHGGRIEVDSKPGNGSTFSIYLPVEEANESDSSHRG